MNASGEFGLKVDELERATSWREDNEEIKSLCTTREKNANLYSHYRKQCGIS